MPKTESPILISSAYFGPVIQYGLIARKRNIVTEKWDNYQKQSYRNRCEILTSNGVEALTVPVINASGSKKVLMKDVLISYDKPWQRDHLRAIKTAYNNTPYFIYYFDEIEALILKSPSHLLTLNHEIQLLIFEMLGMKINESFSLKYSFKEQQNDLRQIIHPKRDMSALVEETLPKYYQVFGDKFGFTPNLSILDLLFNLGPESILYLNSIRYCSTFIE